MGASPYKKEVLEEVKKHNFNKKEDVELFYFRGGFNFNKLNLINKIIMFVFIQIIRHKKEKSDDEKGMVSAYEKAVDFSDKENINKLVKYVRN